MAVEAAEAAPIDAGRVVPVMGLAPPCHHVRPFHRYLPVELHGQ